MSASARVLAPETPMYLLGTRANGPLVVRQRRPSRTLYAPRTPMYQLGYRDLRGLGDVAAGQIVAAGAPVAGAVTTGILASSTSIGSFAGPIGAGVGLIVGLIGGLLAGHELRIKQAKDENSAVNLGVPGYDQGLSKLQQAYKAGQISAADVQQGITVILQNYWQEVAPHIQPGRNGCNNGSSCPPDTSASGKQPCQGDIGAACCVGCYPLTESITNPDGVLAALAGQSTSKGGPFTAQMMPVGASKYGTSYRAGYTLDFTPPAQPAGTGTLASMLAPGAGGTSLMPLLLMGGLLYMAMR